MKSNPSRTLFRTLFATGLIAASLCSCCPKHNTLTQAEIVDSWRTEERPKKIKAQLIRRLDDYDEWLGHRR